MSLTYDVLKDDVRAGRPIDFGFVTYVPERTCRNVEEETEENYFNEEGFFLCSECGEYTKLDWAWHGDVDELRYCARCGAKVVRDDADR